MKNIMNEDRKKADNLFGLCCLGGGIGLFLGIFLCLFDPLPIKILGAGVFVASAVFAAAAVTFSQRG